MDKSILGLKINHELCSACTTYTDNDNVEFVRLDSEDGYFIYRRTLFLIVCTAFYRLYPNYRLKIHRSINKSSYCHVFCKSLFAENEIDALKKEVQKIIASNLPIVEMDGKYTIDTTYQDFGGVLATNTGSVTQFDIIVREGGFVLLYPNNRTNGQINSYSSSDHLMKAIDEYSIWSDILGIVDVSDINERIEHGQSLDMINIQEALHHKKVSQIAERIKMLQPNVKVVLITGPSSSGKTTFSRQLSVHLRVNGLHPINISLDDYYHDRDSDRTPKNADGTYNYEDLESIDYELFNQHLFKLIEGEEVEIPIFDFQLSRKLDVGKKIHLCEGGVLIIEGIHALNEKLSYLVETKNKYKIYCSPLADLNINDLYPVAASDARLVRRMVRDFQFRNSSVENTLSMWKAVQNGEIKNIFRYNESADCIYNTAIIYEFAVFKPYIEPMLKGVTKDTPYYSQAQRLLRVFEKFDAMSSDFIPANSLIREFIGHSSYYGK